jgi:hypothetical protein
VPPDLPASHVWRQRTGARKDKKAGLKKQQPKFGEFSAIIKGYGAALACRLENTKKPGPQQVDYDDDDALRTAGYLEAA